MHSLNVIYLTEHFAILKMFQHGKISDLQKDSPFHITDIKPLC